MPEPSQRGARASPRVPQPFQSPMTDTRAAFGAQTAKAAPPPSMWQPSFVQLAVGALAEQIDIVLGQQVTGSRGALVRAISGQG